MSSKKDGSSNNSNSSVTLSVSESKKASISNSKSIDSTQSLEYSEIVTQITDHLYVTGIDGITGRNFKKYGITCDINISQSDDKHPKGVDYLYISLCDQEEANIAAYFDVAADKIHETAQKGGKTVVHCIVGMSRSVTLAIAYLIKYHKMTLREAFNHIYAKRPIIRPNNGFFRQLIEYEKKIHGKNSVKMTTVTRNELKLEVPDFFVKEHPMIVDEDFEYYYS